MRLWVEIPAFGALAAGLHLALLAGWPGGAPEAAGDGGAASLTLAGASGAVEAMVADWDAPPAVAEAVAMAAPVAGEAASAAPLGDTGPERRAAAPLAEVPAEAPPRVIEDAPDLLPTPELASAAPRLQAPTAVGAPLAPGAEARPARPEAPARPQPVEAAASPPVAEAPPAPATRPRARPAQVAAGTGAAGGRGARNEAAVAGLSDSARRSIVASWGAEIRARVEAGKVHPRGLSASGRPVVRITVARSGALEDVRVIQSSRVAALDEAAVRAVRQAGRFPAAPGALDLARVSFDLPISFTR
jgi:periplasmic protein TonB